MTNWTNPRNVDLNLPYLYHIAIHSPTRVYRYVGKGSAASRMKAYGRNVERVLAGKTKRPAVTRDGRAQSVGNTKYRYVHLVLAAAVQNGWRVEHYPLENCTKEQHSALERQRQTELKCDLNNGMSWAVEDFARLAAELK